jgi:hypothetical protein
MQKDPRDRDKSVEDDEDVEELREIAPDVNLDQVTQEPPD